MARHDFTIVRIPAPSPSEFETAYLLPARPVVLTGLFSAQPLARFTSREEVERGLGSVRILVGEEYTRNLLAHAFQPSHTAPRVMTIDEYLRLADADPKTRLLCSEFHAPAEIRELYQFPEYVRLQGLADDAWSMVFVGNAGNFAHLHFDGDYRHVLLYELFGRKRIVLIPPDSGNKLQPVGLFSQVSLEHFRDRETEDFLRYVGGYQCVLEAGDAIYVPAAWWHFVEYIDTAMSISVRFGRNAYTRTLGDKCHPNCYLQCIASRMIDARTVEQGPLQEHFASIQSVLEQPCGSQEEKGERMQAEFRRICLELNPDFGRSSHIELPSPVHEGYRQLLSRAFYPASSAPAAAAAAGA